MRRGKHQKWGMRNQHKTMIMDSKELIIYVKDEFDSGSDKGKVAKIRLIWNSA